MWNADQLDDNNGKTFYFWEIMRMPPIYTTDTVLRVILFILTVYLLVQDLFNLLVSWHFFNKKDQAPGASIVSFGRVALHVFVIWRMF